MAQSVEGTILSVLHRLLQRYGDMQLIVGYTPATLAPFAYRWLRQLRRAYGERVQLVPDPQRRWSVQSFLEADWTFWPTRDAGAGLPGLLSLYAGSPVIAYNMTSVLEFLHPNNSLTIPCRCRLTAAGVPKPVPNYAAIEACCRALLDNPEKVEEMYGHTPYNASARERAFSDGLLQAFNL
jgi:glycosyltransferase involved in cell wall biosynthesis